MPENLEPFFGKEAVKTVTLTEWMEWASCKLGAPHNVVLPMIQRGSVWAPHKLLDFWDTLLRGMPVGALMASDSGTKGLVKVLVKGQDEGLGEADTDTHGAKVGDISLIDGQQRTLAMMAGWPQALQYSLLPVAIWVDLTDQEQGEYQFRLWATTKAQPFGYSRSSAGGQPLSKLERKKLRLANQAWDKMEAQLLWSQADFMPWEARFALPLTELIENQHRCTLHAFLMKRLVSYTEALEKKVKKASDSQVADEKLSEHENATKIAIQQDIAKHFADKLSALPTEVKLVERIPAIEVALDKILACQFPIIHVRQKFFDDDTTDADHDEKNKANLDPPLAILFKRVGSGGEPLSNADYVYSVIKHHSDAVHGMVEALLKDQKICAIYTPTALVMSAVRLTLLTLTGDSKAQKLTDSAKLDKADFARMIRKHPGFIKEFENHIKPQGSFVSSLKQVLEHISYHAHDFTTGLPKHALCLVQIPLLEVILAWHTLRKPSIETLQGSRLAMVRFVLQGNLCVLDYGRASELAIKDLNGGLTAAAQLFPDQDLLNQLVDLDKPLAYPLPSPKALVNIQGLTNSKLPHEANGLRGETRFAVADEENRKPVELYKRWWNRKGGHVHPMLLWLQREYVHKKFEKEPALAGMDEETPYDFDHLLPSAHWAYWNGAVGDNKFISFPLKGVNNEILDATGHWHVGNSLGNIHVLDSSDNRSLGGTSVSVKLEDDELARNGQILTDDKKEWATASGDEGKPRHWEIHRALAFQTAVEQRTFALYQKFYKDLQCGSSL